MSNRLLATKTVNGPYWTDRHNNAVLNPKGPEKGIVALFHALETLAENYGTDPKESPIGADGYASEYFEDIAQAIIKLLSTEIGRLDGGTVDGAVRKLVTEHGGDGDVL